MPALSDHARKIAYELQFKADMPTSDLARRLKIKSHVVQYHRRQLVTSQIIRKRFLINPYRLGFQKYQLFFSTWGIKKDRNSAIEYLKTHWRTAWFATVSGDFQYAINIIAKSPEELSAFMDDVEEKFGPVFSRKTLAVLSSFVLISKKYLLTENGIKPRHVEFIKLNEVNTITPPAAEDRIVMDVLVRYPDLSLREMAHHAKMPRSTFQYRIERLREEEILIGSCYFISATKIKRLPYVLLIQTVGVRQKIRKAVYDFAKANPLVVNLAEALGAWDYQINIEVQRPEEVAELVNLLYHAANGTISQISSYAIINQLQSRTFLSESE